MIHFTDEGDELKYGINLYRLSDKHNFGFTIRVYNKAYWFRYSKNTKKFHFFVTSKNHDKSWWKFWS